MRRPLRFPADADQRIERVAGFTTASEVVLSPPASVIRRTKLPPNEVEDLLSSLALILCPAPDTITSLSASAPLPRTITLGHPALDSLLGDDQDGGIRVGTLTEIVGESATGKSHLCLHLALNVQRPHARGGLAGGCIILCSEGAFPSGRLQQLAATSAKALDPDCDVLASAQTLMDNVHLLRGEDVESIIHALQYSIPSYIESLASPTTASPASALPVRLLIIDSLAAPIRASSAGSTTSSMVQRSRDLCLVSDALKHLCHVYDMAAVVVNQVTDVIDRPPLGPEVEPRWRSFTSNDIRAFPSSGGPITSSSSNNGSVAEEEPPPAWELLYLTQSPFFGGADGPSSLSSSTSRRKEAALGVVWANAVNARVMLHKTGRRVGALEEGEVRAATCVFGPKNRGRRVEYTVDRSGWRVLEDAAMDERERRRGEEEEDREMWGHFDDVVDTAMLDAVEELAATQSSGAKGRPSSPSLLH